MWEILNNVLALIDKYVWGVPLIVLIIAGGIMLTVRMGYSSDAAVCRWP